MNAVHFRAGFFSRGVRFLLLAILGGSTALAQGVIIFTNAPPVIAAGSVWKYWNDDSAPDPRWNTMEYPASDWPAGAAQLGYGDGDESTVTRTEGIPHPVSAYFRRSFVLPNSVINAMVRIRMVRDDGAVVYINGAEVVRDGMPPGEITHETLATSSAGENENAFREYTATVGYLRAGTNVVAVEVHQVNAASSDLSFDFELNLVANFTLVPVVSLTTVVEQTKESQLLDAIPPGRFRVSRTGSTAEELTVYLKVEGTAMEGHDYPFIGPFIRIPAGRSEVDIVIRAIDDNHIEETEFVNVRLVHGLEGTSIPYLIHGEKFQGRVHILDNDVNTAANLRITEPHAGEVFPRGQPILINAVAVDSNGYIDRVEFYAGTNRIGVSELVFVQAPAPGTPIQHSILWSNAPSGAHSLTAAAWDSRQRRVKSEPVVILVSGEVEIPTVGVFFAPPTTREPWPNADYAPGSFEFYRRGGIDEPLQVFFERGGTAIAGTDYVNFHQHIVFAAGQSRTNLKVQAIDDLLVEGRETVVVGLKPVPLGIDSLYPTYYAIDRTNRAATVVILDNDTAVTRATISITQPDNGDVFAVGTAIPIDAVAVDQNGYIPRVEFYAGATRIGVSEVNFVVAPAPGTPIYHSIEWNNAPAGDHLIVARGIDSWGNAVQSQPVQITVAPRAEGVTLALEVIDPVASEATITASFDTASFRIRKVSGPTNGTVVVWLTMSGTAINGTDYQRINTLVAMPTNQPFMDIVVNPIYDNLVEGEESVILTLNRADCDRSTDTVSLLPFAPLHSCYYILGTNSARAVIRDVNHGTNLPPEVAITTPVDGSVFELGRPIHIAAMANDRGGSISQLDLLIDGQLAWRTNTGGLGFIWTNAPAGEHTLLARAVDNQGATGLSRRVRILVRGSNDFAFVERQLPPGYIAGTPFTVRLAARPPTGAQAWGVEDQPPRGWSVTGISDGGIFDAVNGKVKFGHFTDGLSRILSYQLTPPPGTTGIGEFNGTSSVDGRNSSIRGDRTIAALASEYHPADLNRDRRIVLAEVTGYAAAWKQGTHWQTPPNPVPASYVTRAAMLWRHGEGYRFVATNPPPFCWMPSADLPRAFAASTSSATRTITTETSGARSVALQIEPALGVGGYTVEERVPDGWTVSAVSAEGSFDIETGAIRWGLFMDAEARTLSYELIPPTDPSTAGQLLGEVSLDGEVLGFTGASSVLSVDPGTQLRMAGTERVSEGAVMLKLAGAAGQICALESSSDLVDWSEVAELFLPGGQLEFIDHQAGQIPQRYYRLQAP